MEAVDTFDLGLEELGEKALTGDTSLQPFETNAEALESLVDVARTRVEAALQERTALAPGAIAGLGHPSAQEAFSKLNDAVRAHAVLRSRLAATSSEASAPVLVRALRRWGLGPAEELLFGTALAIAVAPDVAARVARLTNSSAGLTISAAAAILRANDNGVLRVSAFVVPGTALWDLAILRPDDNPSLPLGQRTLVLAHRAIALARGTDGIDPHIAALLNTSPAKLTSAALDDLRRLRDVFAEPREVAVVTGRPGVDARSAISCAADLERRNAIFIDVHALDSQGILASLLREALLHRAVLVFETSAFLPGKAAERLAKVCEQSLRSGVVPAIILHRGVACPPAIGAAVHISLARPVMAERADMWTRALGKAIPGLDTLARWLTVDEELAVRAAAPATATASIARPLGAPSVLREVRARAPIPSGRAIGDTSSTELGADLSARLTERVSVDDEDPIVGIVLGTSPAIARAIAAHIADAAGLSAIELDLARVALVPESARTEIAIAIDCARRGYVPLIHGLCELASREPLLVDAIAAELDDAFGVVLFTAPSDDDVPPPIRRRAGVAIAV
jgi:hypothetical protein